MANDLELTAEELKQLSQLQNPDTPPEYGQYEFGPEMEQNILAAMMTDRAFMTQITDLVRPEFFRQAARQLICQVVRDYWEKYKDIPSKDIVRHDIYQKTKSGNKPLFFYEAELNACLDNFQVASSMRDYLLDQIEEFAKVEAFKYAYKKSASILLSKDPSKWNKMADILRDSFNVSRQKDIGLDYFAMLDERYARMKAAQENGEVFVTGFSPLDQAMASGGIGRGEIAAFVALPGVGKTHRKNTPVLMFDGTIKMCQDVVVGDLVMGPDSKPRKVLSTHSLMDWGYEIKPVKGDSYVVNGEHILSLKNSHRQGGLNYRRHKGKGVRYNTAFKYHPSRMGNTNIYNISVNDWFKQSNHFKTKMKGWRTGVDFASKSVLIDPYILGVWLGDGHSSQPSFTSCDSEVVNAVYCESAQRGLVVRAEKNIQYHIHAKNNNCGLGPSKNSLKNDLRSYGLLQNKRIPYDYKVNDRETRLQLLAGLIDTDGSMSNNCYDFINKNKMLADDVVFLARSLGLAAYMKECRKRCQTGAEGTYYRVTISGDCSQIPVKIERKKCESRKQVKDHLLTGITVVPTNAMEMFYGFEVDGDHLFLLGDFTVVHNSVLLVQTAIENLNRGKKVLFLSLEMDQDKVAKRFDAMLADVGIQDLLLEHKYVIKTLRDGVLPEILMKTGEDKDVTRLVVKQFPAGTADVNTFRAYTSQVYQSTGFRPDLVLVDYVGEMKDYPNMPTWESRQRLCRDLRAWGIEGGHATFTALQPRKEGREKSEGMGVMDDSSVADSFGQVRVLDAMWTVMQSRAEKTMSTARIYSAKVRDGVSGILINVKQNSETLRFSYIDKETYKNIMSLHKEQKGSDTVIDGKASKSNNKFKPNSSGEEVGGAY